MLSLNELSAAYVGYNRCWHLPQSREAIDFAQSLRDNFNGVETVPALRAEDSERRRTIECPNHSGRLIADSKNDLRNRGFDIIPRPCLGHMRNTPKSLAAWEKEWRENPQRGGDPRQLHRLCRLHLCDPDFLMPKCL
jgi:hypothetical protein